MTLLRQSSLLLTTYMVSKENLFALLFYMLCVLKVLISSTAQQLSSSWGSQLLDTDSSQSQFSSHWVLQAVYQSSSSILQRLQWKLKEQR